MTNTIKQRLASNQPCIGAWVTIPSVKSVDALLSCGFHWMAVDLEHGTMSLEMTEGCFVAAERHGVLPMARLPSHDPYMARRLLDAGAGGIIVPEVISAQRFTEFSRHCIYPPTGARGVGLSRCNGYGDRFESYFENFSPVLVPQIESIAGVSAVKEIAALAEVDAIFLGPYDLSVDLGEPGNFRSPRFEEAIETVKAACTEYRTALGIHQVEPDPKELEKRISEGFCFIAYSTDAIAMRAAIGRPLDSLDT